MRFSLAREAGLDEQLAQLIDDEYAAAELDPSWTVALQFTDHFLNSPGPLPPALDSSLRAHFDPGELTELALGLALFHGFSKMLIALGLEPDHMDTTIVPTPAASPLNSTELDLTDPHVALLSDRPDLACRWQDMRDALDSTPHVEPDIVAIGRARVAQLLGVDWAPASPAAPTGPTQSAVLELAELFVIDVRAIESQQLEAVEATVGEAGLVQVVMSLAVYDGIYRYAVTVGPDRLVAQP